MAKTKYEKLYGLLDPLTKSGDEIQPIITESDRNKTLQQWLLEERIIAQRYREKCNAQVDRIRELQRELALTENRLASQRKQSEKLRDQIFEEICDILENEDVNMVLNARDCRRRRLSNVSTKKGGETKDNGYKTKSSATAAADTGTAAKDRSKEGRRGPRPVRRG